MSALYFTLTEELSMTERDIFRELSPLPAEIARAIGLPSLLLIMEKLGGHHLHLPTSPKSQTPLSSIIGYEAVRKIQGFVIDGKITIPNNFGSRKMKRLHALKMIREGRTINEIVSALGVSRTSVKTWKKEIRCA